MVPEEEDPLAGLGDGRGLLEHVHDRVAVFGLDGHEHPGHQGEMERGLALVPTAEIRDRVFRPLVGLGQEHLSLEARIDVRAQLLEGQVGLGEVLAIGAFALEEVRDGVEAQPVHAHLPQPEVHCLEHRLAHLRAVPVQVRLVRVEAVPVVLGRHRVPRPVRGLEVLEDDPRLLVLLRGVAPDVEVAGGAARGGPPRALEPRVLVRRVVEDELGDHLQAARVGVAQHALAVAQRPVRGVDAQVVRGVVAVVLQGRGIERQQPDRGDAEVLEVVELAREAGEVPDAVRVRVGERTDVQLVEDRVLVPEGIAVQLRLRGHPRAIMTGGRRLAAARPATSATAGTET